MRFTFDVQYCRIGDTPAENIMTCSFEASNIPKAEMIATAITTAATKALEIEEKRAYERTGLERVDIQ